MADSLSTALSLAHVVVAAGAFAFLAWLGPRAFRTPLWMPLLMVCSGIASFALIDLAGELVLAQGDAQRSIELDIAAQSGVILSIAGLVHLAAVYPRRLDNPWVRASLVAFYALALVGIFLAPLQVRLDPSAPGGAAIVAGPGLLGGARRVPVFVGLIATMVWFGFLGLRGRNERERKAGVSLCIAVAAALAIAVALPLSGLPISQLDTALFSVAAWLIGAGVGLARGGLPIPVHASLRRFMESSRDALLFVDADTLIGTMNPVAVELLGAKDGWEGRPFEEVMAPAFKDAASWKVVASRIGDVLLAKSLKTDAEADRVGQDERPFRIIIDPLRTDLKRGRADGAVIRMRDISSERAAEESSKRAQALQDLVIRVMGHDLKAPITVIGGYLQLAGTRLTGPMGEAEREATASDLRKALQATALMQVIMANARAVSRLTMGAAPDMRRDDLNLAKMLREVTDILKPLADAKQLTLEVEAPEVLHLPLVAGFESVITNLLSNAIKYTPERGMVTVTLRGGDHPTLEVADTGPGIPEEQRPRLFQKFERLTKEQGVGSHGLGLSIASTLVG